MIKNLTPKVKKIRKVNVMGTSEAQKRAQKKWDTAHKDQFRIFNLKINKETDGDVVEHLEKQQNVQGYIKALVRSDMASGK